MALPHNFCPTFGEHFRTATPPLTSAPTGVMLFTRRQPDGPATTLNQFCSIRTSNGVYTELGIDPIFPKPLAMSRFISPIPALPGSTAPTKIQIAWSVNSSPRVLTLFRFRLMPLLILSLCWIYFPRKWLAWCSFAEIFCPTLLHLTWHTVPNAGKLRHTLLSLPFCGSHKIQQQFILLFIIFYCLGFPGRSLLKGATYQSFVSGLRLIQLGIA